MIDNLRILAGMDIISAVSTMCIKASTQLPDDVKNRLDKMKNKEPFKAAKDILNIIQENAEIAQAEEMPMCQDTGMVVVFLEIGKELYVEGDTIEDLVNEGVRQGYEKGFLRKSVVADPLNRANTGDNTPAVIHQKIVGGNQLKITVVPKGFGSENMSRVYMLKPSDGENGVIKAVLETVEAAGPNACPPMVIGIGIGGTFDQVTQLAKIALIRPLGSSHKLKYYDSLEKRLLENINNLGIGPQGFGGLTTALGVHIEIAPTHIAGLPVAINIGCHASRHQEIIL
jgi:fumarate hydratase subunit alpha